MGRSKKRPPPPKRKKRRVIYASSESSSDEDYCYQSSGATQQILDLEIGDKDQEMKDLFTSSRNMDIVESADCSIKQKDKKKSFGSDNQTSQISSHSSDNPSNLKRRTEAGDITSATPKKNKQSFLTDYFQKIKVPSSVYKQPTGFSSGIPELDWTPPVQKITVNKRQQRAAALKILRSGLKVAVAKKKWGKLTTSQPFPTGTFDSTAQGTSTIAAADSGIPDGEKLTQPSDDVDKPTKPFQSLVNDAKATVDVSIAAASTVAASILAASGIPERTMRSRTKYFCTICKKDRNWNCRSGHMQKHKDGLILVCPYCNANCQKPTYKAHLENCKSRPNAAEKVKCEFCGSKLTNVALYRRHLKRCKKKPQKITAVNTSDKASDTSSSGIPDSGMPDETKQPCPICSKQVNSKGLARHIKNHRKGTTMPCPNCFEWITHKQYEPHTSKCLFGEKADKTCPHCEQEFTSKSSLKSHLQCCPVFRNSENNVKNPCEFCPNTEFYSQNALKSHKRWHRLLASGIPEKDLPEGMSRCQGEDCPICDHVIEGPSFTDISQKTHKIKGKFSCLSENLIYRLTCSKPGCEAESYIGQTGRSSFERWLEYKSEWLEGFSRNNLEFQKKYKFKDLTKPRLVIQHFLKIDHSFENMKFMVIEASSNKDRKIRIDRETFWINSTRASLNMLKKTHSSTSLNNSLSI